MKRKSKLQTKIFSILMTLLLLTQTAISPVLTYAQSNSDTTSSIVQVEGVQEEQPIVDSIEETINEVESLTDSEDETQSAKSESFNANDSPTDNTSDLETYLAEQDLTIDSYRNIRYTNGNDTIDSEVYETIMSMLGKNIFGRAGSTVLLDTSNGIYINVTFSDGSKANNWYPKRADGEVAFCVQHGVVLHGGSNTGYTQVKANSDEELAYALIAYFGYYTQKSYQNELLTQFMIWELQGTSVTALNGNVSMSTYNKFKEDVNAKIKAFKTKPSFDSETIELNVGESITLTDTNKVFANYAIASNNSGITVTQNGNQVTLKATENSKESGTVKFEYEIDNAYKGTSIYFEHPNLQNVIISKIHAQTNMSLNIKVNKEGYMY